MAKKKYYAVRVGYQTGIFNTWDECKKQTSGYSGAEFKSFETLEEAEAFLGNVKKKAGSEETGEQPVEIYVDGSYYGATGEFSYGMVVLADEEKCFSRKFQDKELAQMHNVAGEIKGAEAAMQYAMDHGIHYIRIYHDYEGIAKWCTGAWKANKAGTIAYRNFYQEASKKIRIEFAKVKGHSNDKYNDMVDQLAKEALGIR